jgi:hypothetical protein
MTREVRCVAVVFVTLLASAASAATAAAPGERRSFVACPIVRDTSTVPCWLAEHEGELYFLTLQTDVSAPVNPPQLGHQVLVEGVVSDEPRVCGGVVLKPVVLSVLPELDSSCSTILPAEERYNLTFEPPRPPGPSRGRLAFGDPAPPAKPRPAEASAGPRTFSLQYDFDGLIAFRHAQSLQQIFEYASGTGATHVAVTAYRASVLLSNGKTMTEREDIARRRAEQVASLLKDAGLTRPAYEVRWLDAPTANGTNDAALRKVDLVVRRE